MTRTTLTSAQLYTILDREFRRLKPAACGKCRAPIPFLRPPPDEVSANWDIAAMADCPEGCHRVIAELLARLWSRYDLAPERAQ